MPKTSAGASGVSRLDERTASIAARWAGLALREPRYEAARRLVNLGLMIGIDSDQDAYEDFLDWIEDDLRRTRRRRQRSTLTTIRGLEDLPQREQAA